MKIGSPSFWPSYHYSSVVQTASNWNLQKLLKSELQFMRYCNLKFGYNNEAPNFWPCYHYSSVVQTASNWNLQKLLKLELQFMRYCNLKLRYNSASVKSTAFQNCVGKKNTPWQTKFKPHQKIMEHKMCLTICIVTKPHLGKVCIFLPILFIGKMIHYIICVIPILLCCYHTFHLGLKVEFKHSLQHIKI